MNFFLHVFSFLICFSSFAQVYDVLELENFDTRTNLAKTGGNWYHETPTCSTVDMFEVTANMADPTDILDYVNYEIGSVFACFDKDDASVGSPTELIIFNYTADHMDHISFVGNFAFATNCGASGFTSSDKLDLYFSTDGGSTWSASPALTFTGTDGGAAVTSDYFTSSDGTANVQSDFLQKEFAIGSGLSGQTIKVKVVISGFTSGGEGFMLDEFRLVRTRTLLACEDFNSTASLTSSSGVVFQTPSESATCGNNALYDVTANMATPSDATNCLTAEDGSFFVMTKRNGLSGVADGEELVLLTYTATDNNHISFRGNFASFADDQNTDNNIVVSYSTDNGTTYTDALTITGVSGRVHEVSDGTPSFGNYFLTKGFPIGSGLLGHVIKIKVTFNNYANGGDGIALDKFCLEASVDPLILPVTLVTFKGNAEKSLSKLEWSTMSEINNSHFELQRSNNGETWQNIHKELGAGNSATLKQYQFFDLFPLIGANYYRLKQVDFDGTYTFSKVIVVKFESGNPNISPNPVKQFEPITIEGVADIQSLEIYSIGGRLMKRVIIDPDSDIKITADFPKGFYFIKLYSKQNSFTRKILVE